MATLLKSVFLALFPTTGFCKLLDVEDEVEGTDAVDEEGAAATHEEDAAAADEIGTTAMEYELN